MKPGDIDDYDARSSARIREYEERVEHLKSLLPSAPIDPEQKQLPFWPDPERASPNALIASSLFGSARKREWVKDQPLHAWGDTKIQFTGETFNQYDETVWLQLVHTFRLQGEPESHKVAINGRGMLREMGSAASGNTHRRLHDSIRRLVACMVVVKHNGYEYGSSLLVDYKFDAVRRRYWVQMNPDFLKLFGTGFTRFDWETRKALPTGVATWMHRYCHRHRATAKHPHRINLERLRELSKMRCSRKEFKRSLKRAMDRLKLCGVVAEWRITPNEALEYSRPPKRHRKELQASSLHNRR